MGMLNLHVSTISAVVLALTLGLTSAHSLRAQEKPDTLPKSGEVTIESSTTEPAKADEAEKPSTDPATTANASEVKVEREKPSWDLNVQPSKTVSILKVYGYLNDPDKIKNSSDRSIEFEQKYFNHGAVTKEQLRQRTGQYFTVSWKNDGPAIDYVLRLDYRQAKTKDQVYTLQIVFPAAKGSNKATFSVTGDAYEKLGRVTSWRASVVRGDVIVAEKKSFAW